MHRIKRPHHPSFDIFVLRFFWYRSIYDKRNWNGCIKTFNLRIMRNFNYYRLVFNSEKNQRIELQQFDDGNLRKLNTMINRHILYVIIICLFIFIITIFKIGCPFLYIFKIPCPSCGCTRAIVSLLRLDIKGYLKYQPFAIPLIISTWLILHSSKFTDKKIIYFVTFLILILNFIFYIIKLL